MAGMTTVTEMTIDADRAQSPTPTAVDVLDAGSRPAIPRLPRFGAAGLVSVVALVLAAVAIFRPVPVPLAVAEPRGARPAVIVEANGEPYSAIAWYIDGTQGDASAAITSRWTPDRPVLMITVAARQSCSITVDDRLAVAQTAPVNRLALCVWRAPS